jgi:hypothetical protein
MVPTANSYALFEHIPAAQLSLYPNSSHDLLFQHNRLLYRK